MQDIEAKRAAARPGPSSPAPRAVERLLVDPRTGQPTAAYRSAAAEEMRGGRGRPAGLLAALVAAAARRLLRGA